LKVFENRALRRAFGPRKEDMAGGWRRLHHEELRKFYASTKIIRVIISRGMRWAEHVTWIGEMRNAYKILVGKPEGRDHLEDLSVDGKIILKWNAGK
jgi:hypothetical protein